MTQVRAYISPGPAGKNFELVAGIALDRQKVENDADRVRRQKSALEPLTVWKTKIRGFILKGDETSQEKFRPNPSLKRRPS